MTKRVCYMMQEPSARDIELVAKFDDYAEDPKGCLYRNLAADKQYMVWKVFRRTILV